MLGNVAMDYLVGKFQQEMHDMPVTFTRNLEKWTQYDLDSDKFVMHYHGDGFKKTARKMEVLKKQKSTTEPVKVHHSVFKLREQDNFFYSERYNSFATRVPIKYDPINLKDLGSNIIHMPWPDSELLAISHANFLSAGDCSSCQYDRTIDGQKY